MQQRMLGCLEWIYRRERAVPMAALTFASVTCVCLVVARIFWTGQPKYFFLVWNLLLALLPLLFALLAADVDDSKPHGRLRFLGLSGAWLLFFPNAPYIFTDIIHLATSLHSHFWVDLSLVLLTALTGLVSGFLSLFLMQSLVARSRGPLLSWLFVAVVAGLSGFGIYLGRFLRFNSWDVITQPVALAKGIGHWVTNPLAHSTTFAFPILFATFLFVSYLLLYALTHLQHAEPRNA
jgi:uncharacterized membrane protein